MHVTTDKSAAAFFAWLSILLIASLGYGYFKLMVHQEFVIYTSEENILSYIVSSSDAQ